jgi:hypothetical protein
VVVLMACEICDAFIDLTDNEFLKYTLSTVVGFAGAYGVQWLRDQRSDARIRASVRESLAEELASNLEVLDSYETTFRQGLAEVSTTGLLRWPSAQLKTAMLEQCLDPVNGSLLSQGERFKIPAVYYNLMYLEDEMTEAHRKILGGSSLPNVQYKRFLDRVLPAAAQNQLDFLIQVIEHQSVFASSRLVEITETLLPYHSSGVTHAPRLWRTSYIPKSPPFRPNEKLLLAWQNDAPHLVPEGIRVIEIRPTERTRFSFDVDERRDQSWIERRRLRKWRQQARTNAMTFRAQLAARKPSKSEK